MQTKITREDAVGLLLKYNKDPFHIRHAVTVEAVMRYFAEKLGYGGEADYWAHVGLLHDVDFENYPEQHCIKAPELLKEIGAEDEFINSVCSHGWGITVDIKPEHEMEKVLFAADELTGLIWAAALMRPSKSVSDMELKNWYWPGRDWAWQRTRFCQRLTRQSPPCGGCAGACEYPAPCGSAG